MGKIEAEAHITHFSHPHPLNLKSINLSDPNTTKCSACQKHTSGLVYTCDPCSYSLHKLCSEMPEKLNHKADRKHALTLLPAPAYSTGSFHCNACGVVGTSFCYHCGECELDLHPACAFTKSSVKGGAHEHPLQLCFEPPYEDRTFICDVCGGSGSNHWLYRCEACGFDAHLKCGKADKVRRQQAKTEQRPQYSSSRSVNSQQARVSRSQSVGGPSPTSIYQQQPWHQLQRYETAPVGYAAPVVYGVPNFMQPPTRNDAVQNVVNSVIEGLIEGAANQLGQALMQGALGN
ncbi:protein VACUOLELESS GAMETOPHYTES-like [Salvia miltiorrhiza]|uniref:protein VACUOLELESS GAMETOPHYTES-like n=1 Tax=Salvia miltiorrhiza TaxID=226208 RepID=UPI0025AD2B72|nr:protein VACUOLELESS GAMETOPHYTES-like [Salvia miltiorrhiza]